MTTILVPNDVPEYTGMDLRSSPCTFRHLYSVELYEARECLGEDFRNDLIAALADYSAVVNYVANTNYTTGTVVKFNGVYRKATKDTTQVPSVSTDWENAPRFDTANACGAKYETLFCNFLAPYLAAKVLANRLPFIWSKISDKGVVEYSGGSFETVDNKTYDRTIRAVYRDANMALSNLQSFMEDNKDDVCYANWPDIKEDDSTDCGCNKTTCRTCNPVKVGWYDFG